ncbi:MAG: hypothetical protein JXB88_12520 [Spirochaetales bacterium]|nr:hypothetical protein [Spirochaetales bacterium]
MKTKKSNIIISIAGYSILILSFGFIIYSLKNIDLKFLFTEKHIPFLFFLIPLFLLYSGVVLLLAVNFSVTMSRINKDKKINLLIVPGYLKANIGKYLPTNLFHFAGRHILFNTMGYENKKILAGNIIEFIILIGISLLLLLTGILGGFISIPQAAFDMILRNRILFTVIITAAVLIIIILLIKFRIKNFIARVTSLLSGLKPGIVLLLVLSYSVFFIVSGTMLYSILTYFSGIPFSMKDLLYALFSFSVCWQIGFISPGVPGGIGVREALLLLFFKDFYGETIAFYSGIVLRLITISGDVIAFFYAFLLNKLFRNIRTEQ